MRSRKVFFVAMAVLTLSLPALTAPLSVAELELIQSVPRETDLAQPDLRHAKDAWVAMIDGARERIDLAQFYLSAEAGQALDPVIEALERAGERGVSIRLLVSDELLGEYTETFERMKKIQGIEPRVYDISKITGGILHAKYWIIDGREVFIGSQNFDWRALTEIHELGMRVPSRELAARFSAIFETDWEIAATGAAPERPVVAPGEAVIDGVELVASPARFNPQGIRPAEEALVDLIRGAKESLEIQLLSYSTQEGNSFWPVIDNALREASVRGVKIRMLLSHWNLKPPKGNHTQSLAMLPNVDIRIAEIPESVSLGFVPHSRVIHSKYMVVDGKTLWMGTSNWSEDYFRHSRNLELVVHRPELASKTGEIFEKLWASAYARDVLEFNVEDWKDFSPAKPFKP